MDRYEFLRAVLPPSGNGSYVAHLISTKGSHYNRHSDTIEGLADLCAEASDEGMTAYYALGTFENNIEKQASGRTKVLRKAALAAKFKTLAIDIDVGKGNDTTSYPTIQDAADALLRFLKAVSLPPPMVVSSGNGLHVYWPLTEAISTNQWKALGFRMKALCAKHSLIIDVSKVHDPAMVLRPVGTMNKGNPVRVISQGAGFNGYASLLNALPEDKLPKPQKVSAADNLTELMIKSMVQSYPPINGDEIVQHCAQLREATKDHGKGASYFQWFFALGTAKYADDPIATATEWTSGHSEFSPESLQRKMDEYHADGPPSCSQHDAKTPGICGRCPHWGKIKNPYRLGIPKPKLLKAGEAAPAVKVEQSLPDLPPVVEKEEPPRFEPNVCAPAIDPPPPFVRSVAGISFVHDGIVNVVTSYDIFPTQIVRDPSLGYVMVEWAWNKPHVGYVKMMIRASAIFNDNSVVELNTALADNGLLIESKTKQAQMGVYMRAYTQLLQQHQASIDLYDSFGWKDNYNKFVLGATEMRVERDGRVTSHEVGVSKTIHNKKFAEAFVVQGSMNEWITWTELLNHDSLHLHQIELLRGFMTPLIAFSGIKGMVFSMVGETGAGKSSMMRWAASIYGKPDKIITSAKDTHMSYAQRMGIWGNIPLGVDEVTLIKPELMADMIYWATQGQDRNRVSDTTQAMTWELTLALSTNRAIRDKLSLAGADMEAVQMRLIEMVIPKSPIFADSLTFGRRLWMMTDENCGHVGRVYLAHLLKIGPTRIKADINEAIETFKDRYKYEFSGKERFWFIGTALMDLAGKYASELGLIRFDYTKGIAALLESFEEQRGNVHGKKLDPYDMVSEYLNAHAGQTISVQYREYKHGGRKAVPTEPLPRGEVRVRMEFYAMESDDPERGFFYVDKAHFQHWLIDKGFDVKHALDTYAADNVSFKPTKTGRISMGKDTKIPLATCAVLGFTMQHERLLSMMPVHKPKVELVQQEEKAANE